MKKILKIVLALVVLLVIVFAGGIFYMTRNMDDTKNTTLSGVKLSNAQDGVYMGSYSSGRFSNKLEVTIKAGKILGIKILKDVTFAKPEVSKELFDKVIAAQNTIVDIVSGATVTSKAYLKSIETAINR